MSNPKWKKLKDMDFSELEKRCLVSLMSGVPVEAMNKPVNGGTVTDRITHSKPNAEDIDKIG